VAKGSKQMNQIKSLFSVMTFGALVGVGALIDSQSAHAEGASAQAAWQITTVKGVVFVNPKGATHSDKIDFAELERRYPIDKKSLQAWTQADLAKLNQEQLDQLYARLTAGPIPDGAYVGDIVFTKDGGLEGIARQFFPIDPLVQIKFTLLRDFAKFLWKGKHFYRQEAVLRNLIPDDTARWLTIKAIAVGLLGTHPDYNKLVKTNVSGHKFMEIFPAKLFCGQSLLDSRRESVVIDYAYGDTLSGYNSDIDFLATREGLGVRDEIRMVRPGLYLGRAYLRQVFGLIFTLSNSEAQKQGDVSESCWTGTQPHAN
jgi:hypothetical protein